MDGEERDAAIRTVDVFSSRRGVLRTAAGGVVGGLLTAPVLGHARAQEETTTPASATPMPGTMDMPFGVDDTNLLEERTGAVRLFLGGERPQLKSGSEILEIAKALDYFDDGRHEETNADGSIVYVPRTFGTTDPHAEAMMVGRTVMKVYVTGTPPQWPELNSGTYYVWLDYVNGRWVGRIVNEQGGVDCTVIGAEVKTILYFGTDLSDAHKRPTVSTHGLGLPEEGTTAAEGPVTTLPGWTFTNSGWTDVGGVGCSTTTICMPGT